MEGGEAYDGTQQQKPSIQKGIKIMKVEAGDTGSVFIREEEMSNEQ